MKEITVRSVIRDERRVCCSNYTNISDDFKSLILNENGFLFCKVIDRNYYSPC